MLAVPGCADRADGPHPFGAQQADLGAAQEFLGWNIRLANLRFESGFAVVDLDLDAAADPAAPRAAADDLRFGLYGALAHPIEAGVSGGCDAIGEGPTTPLAGATPDRLTGTVCLGPITDQAQVRGVYAYSPRERLAGTTIAYPAAFPVGVPGTEVADTALTLTTTSVEAWRADGRQLTAAALGDPTAFTGNGYMLMGLRAAAAADEYRAGASARGGPLMLLAGPTLAAPGLSRACSAYGASVLLLPEASLDAVQIDASLCTQGEINAALLYATVSVAGTRAALWSMPREDT